MNRLIFIVILIYTAYSCTWNSSLGDEPDPDHPGDAGTFTDPRDGRVYHWINIENQTWMAENLAYLPAVYPPAEGGYEERFYYVQGFAGHDTAEAVTRENYVLYGVLYNWKASQSACPAGWHVASDEEWKDLERNLGMNEADEDETGDRTSGGVGKKIKSRSGWFENGNGNNRIGFGAMPGGSRNATGEFGSTGMRANFRTSSAAGSSVNFTRSLNYDSDGISRSTAGHHIGLSVRCVKD